MIKDKRGLDSGCYYFNKNTGLASGIYKFSEDENTGLRRCIYTSSRNKKEHFNSNNRGSVKKETLSDSMKRIHSKETQEEKNAKNKHKIIHNISEGNIPNVAKSQKGTTRVEETYIENGQHSKEPQRNDISVIYQKVKQALESNNDMVINGNEDIDYEKLERVEAIKILKEGKKAYDQQQKVLKFIKNNLATIVTANVDALLQQCMNSFHNGIKEMINQITSCQETLRQKELAKDPQLESFCNYMPMDPRIAALWPKRNNEVFFDPKNNDFDNFSNTVHSNTDTNYETTIPNNYEQFIKNPEQFIKNPLMNKNPFISKNNPLTNGGKPVTFCSYDPTYNTNMTGQDPTNVDPLNNSQMMVTYNNRLENLPNYDYYNEPIINSGPEPVGNYQNLNLWQGKY